MKYQSTVYGVIQSMRIAALTVGLLLGAFCESITPEDELPGMCKECDREDNIHVGLLAPSGGETYHVGDTLTVLLCSDAPDQYVLVDVNMSISFDGGISWEGLYIDQSSNGTIGTWVIPPTVDIVNMNTLDVYEQSTVSDKVLIRAAVYNTNDDYDQTAAPITILPPREE